MVKGLFCSELNLPTKRAIFRLLAFPSLTLTIYSTLTFIFWFKIFATQFTYCANFRTALTILGGTLSESVTKRNLKNTILQSKFDKLSSFASQTTSISSLSSIRKKLPYPSSPNEASNSFKAALLVTAIVILQHAENRYILTLCDDLSVKMLSFWHNCSALNTFFE